MNNLQNYLINKRKELKLSLRNASELIGISHSYLSTLEKGIDPRNNTPVKPTPETLKLISTAYNVSYELLMKLTGYLEQDVSPKPSSKEPTSVLSEKDERDIEKRIEQLRKDFMESSEGLMLSGDPVSPEAIESILDALSYGVRQAKVINKKYTPKKYK
jgi:transcriptional regulator with XRE-family HTH domain